MIRPNKLLTRAIRYGLTICAFGALTAGTALAGPMVTYLVDQNAGGVTTAAGTVTVSANNANELLVSFTLAPNLIVNTGGPHTPFAFNSSVSLSSPAITVTAPAGAACGSAPSPCFVPTYASGAATPFGTLNEAFNYTGNNGTGAGNPGPLTFTIDGTGVGVFDTTKHQFDLFTANGSGAIFAADLSVSGSTGTWIATTGTCSSGCTSTPVPEPFSVALLGTALIGLGAARRFFR